MTAASRTRPSIGTVAWALAVDVVLVVIFAVIGRASHAEHLSVSGVWQTAWPFLVGLGAGWVLTMAWRAPRAPIRTGAGVWAVTLVLGMLLRGVSGQGVVPAFVVVASIVLCAFLVGWRAIAALLARRSRVS